MAKIIKMLIVVIAGSGLTGCAVMMEAASQISKDYIEWCDNNQEDPLNLYNEAQTWQHSNASKGLLLTELGLGVADEFTKKDLSNITGIVKNTRNAYTENNSPDNNQAATIVGLLTSAGAQTLGYFEDRNKKWDENMGKYYETERNANNPNHPDYDPYFKYRFIIDNKHKKIIRRSNDEFMRLVREAQVAQTDKDLVNYGIISQSEYDAKYGTPELKSENAASYQEVCHKLGLCKHNKRYANNTAPSTEGSISANSQTGKPTNSNLSAQTDNNDSSTNKIIEQINNAVVDNYAFDTYTLSAEQMLELNSLVNLLKTDESIQVTIIGHTCHIGTDRANESVGIKRANYAKQYLIDCGIEESRISTKTVGATEPISDKKDLDSRLANRRISFKAIKN